MSGPVAGEFRLGVSGELDLESAPGLLDSILSASGAAVDGERIVVDLGDVSFIDSSGLAALVDAHRRVTDRAQHLVVANPAAGVWRIFTLAGIDQILTIERTPTPVD